MAPTASEEDDPVINELQDLAKRADTVYATSPFNSDVEQLALVVVSLADNVTRLTLAVREASATTTTLTRRLDEATGTYP